MITDPPYGIAWDTDYSRFTSGARLRVNAQQRTWPRIVGDDQPFNPSHLLGFPIALIWGANCFLDKLPDNGTWLIWDKRFPNGKAFLCDGDLVWMNKGRGIYIKSVTCQGFIRPEPIEHPTQKPVELMAWCIEKAGYPETILDPYCGSGSTLVAAAKLGSHFLGFEINAEYCRVARERVNAALAEPRLFPARRGSEPEAQGSFLDNADV